MVHITSRAEWGANPLNTPANTIAVPAPELWLHHTASSGLHGASGMRSLQAGALAGGYVDLEYTVCADTDGTAFMSRGPAHNTAATADHNTVSHAVCCMGNFETDMPSDRLLDVIVDLAVWLYAGGWSRTRTFTGPHRDASGNSTACCGRHLIDRIPEINNVIMRGGDVTPKHPEGLALDICPTPSGRGYYVCADDGGVFAYGDAPFHGSMGGQRMNAPCVGMCVHPKGAGYWLVGADGGVFAFGNVRMFGSMGGKPLAEPITGIVATPSGNGYWLVAADGGVFAFGDAPFLGAPTGLIE